MAHKEQDLMSVAPLNARFVWGEVTPMPLYNGEESPATKPATKETIALATEAPTRHLGLRLPKGP